MRSKVRQRLKIFTIAAVLGVAGAAALPAAEAQAKYCANTKLCYAEINNFGGGWMDTHFDGWGNQNYFVEVNVGLMRWCTFNANGNDPPVIRRCHGMPSGLAWSRSNTSSNANHDISVWAP